MKRRLVAFTAAAFLVTTIALGSSVLGGFVPTAHAAIIGGVAPNCPQPPTGHDLSTLSASELAYYGLPPRPTDVSRIPHWTFVVQHLKRRWCKIAQAKIEHYGAHSTFGKNYILQESNPIWAGVVAVNGGYSSVSATWQVPSVYAPQRTFYMATVWVGIGGDTTYGDSGGNVLVQAGTGSFWYRPYDSNDPDCTGTGTNYCAWIEDAPGQKELDLYKVTPGDHMDVTVDNYSSSINPLESYYVDDTSSGTYYGQSFAGPSANDGTAEWIVERWSGYPLARFQVPGCPNGGYCVTFNNCQVTRNGSVLTIGAIPSGSVHSAAIYNNAGTAELAYPGPIHNGTFFNTYWLAYGP